MIYNKSYTPIQNLVFAYKDTYSLLNKFINRVWYHLNGGYDCDSCGVKLPIHWTVLETEVNGKRMIISNYSSSGQLYCAHCLAEKVESYFSTFPDTEEDIDYWTKKKDQCLTYISSFDDENAKQLDLDMRWGSNYWNGHPATKSTLLRGFHSDKVQYRTEVMSNSKNGFVYIDKNGIKL